MYFFLSYYLSLTAVSGFIRINPYLFVSPADATLMIKFSFVITHPTNSAQNPPTIEDSQEVPLEAYIGGKRNPERDKLLRLLAGNATEDTW